MFILDTNVLSELIRPVPSPNVLEWFSSYESEAICTTSITVAEIWYGVKCMPDGKRKDLISSAIKQLFEQDFQGGILDFDHQAAILYGELGASLRKKGSAIGQGDTMIAAIGLSLDATIITRNTKHLSLTGVNCLNPFL